MNKSYPYTVLTLLLALAIVFGSMQGMRLILRIREKQLLSEKGRAEVEMPVRAWQEREKAKQEPSEDPDEEGSVLTREQLEEVIGSWNKRTYILVHSPVEGQIDMAEAIQTGVEWLIRMGGQDLTKYQERDEYSVSATLGVSRDIVPDQGQLEPYYSFWIVQCSSPSMCSTLYINAVTGKVWSAEITMFDRLPEEIPYENLGLFVELSGLEVYENAIFLNTEGTQAIWKVEGGRIYAHMQYQKGSRYSGNAGEEYVRIVYDLTVDDWQQGSQAAAG